MNKDLDKFKKILWNILDKMIKKLVRLKQFIEDYFRPSNSKKQSLTFYLFILLIYYIISPNKTVCSNYLDYFTYNFENPFSPTMVSIINMHDYIMLLLGIIIITKLLFFSIALSSLFYDDNNMKGWNFIRQRLLDILKGYRPSRTRIICLSFLAMLAFLLIVLNAEDINCIEGPTTEEHPPRSENNTDTSSDINGGKHRGKRYFYRRRLLLLFLATVLFTFIFSLVIYIPAYRRARAGVLSTYLSLVWQNWGNGNSSPSGNSGSDSITEEGSESSSDSFSEGEALIPDLWPEIWRDNDYRDYMREAHYYNPYEVGGLDHMPTADVVEFYQSRTGEQIVDVEWTHPVDDTQYDPLIARHLIRSPSSDEEEDRLYNNEGSTGGAGAGYDDDEEDTIPSEWSFGTLFRIFVPTPASLVFLFSYSLLFATISVSVLAAAWLCDASLTDTQQTNIIVPEVILPSQDDSIPTEGSEGSDSVTSTTTVEEEQQKKKEEVEEEQQKKKEEVEATKTYLLIAVVIIVGTLTIIKYCC